MKRVFGYMVTLLVGCALVGGNCTRRAVEARQHQSVLAAENRRFAATVAADTAALRALIHPHLVYTHSNGLVENQAEHLLNVGGGRIDYQRFEKVGPDTLLVSNDHATLNSRVRVDGLYEGSSFEVFLGYRSRYLQQEGEWLLEQWTSTKLK